ncbi:MAG TPA: hypothetical protein VEL76_19225 [Gemmataceae bacterium]|nr:hypothetical protein [Gemmataceae bacterium]
MATGTNACDVSAATLLTLASTAGLKVSVDGDRLVVRGSKSAEELARALLARKAEVLPLLATPPATPVGGHASAPWDKVGAGSQQRDTARHGQHPEPDGAHDVVVLRALDRLDPDGGGAGFRQLVESVEMPRPLAEWLVCRLHERGIVELCSVVVTLGSGEKRSVLGIRRVPRDGRVVPSSETRAQQPPPASAFVWDQAAAEHLLADLHATVERIKSKDFRGRPPPLFLTLAANTLGIAKDYLRDHELEAARGWDVLDLLQDQKQVLLEITERIKAGLTGPAS